jgi:hypothetical protein
MTHAVPTVAVKAAITEDNPTGYVVINESDFDPSQHEKFGAGESDDKPSMTAKEMKAALTERGIEFAANASKADLQALLDGAE